VIFSTQYILNTFYVGCLAGRRFDWQVLYIFRGFLIYLFSKVQDFFIPFIFKLPIFVYYLFRPSRWPKPARPPPRCASAAHPRIGPFWRSKTHEPASRTTWSSVAVPITSKWVCVYNTLITSFQLPKYRVEFYLQPRCGNQDSKVNIAIKK